MPKKYFYVIIGNVASGKSSALPYIVQAINGKPIYADNLFQKNDPFRELFLRDLPRWALANELWLTVKRADLYQKGLSNSHSKPLVIDSGLLMSWVYTYGHFAAGKLSIAEWNLYQLLYDRLSVEQTNFMRVIYINYPIRELLLRLKKRGRKYELEYYSEGYLKQIDTGINQLLNKLNKNKIPILTITSKEIGNYVHDKSESDKLIKIISDWISNLK